MRERVLENRFKRLVLSMIGARYDFQGQRSCSRGLKTQCFDYKRSREFISYALLRLNFNLF